MCRNVQITLGMSFVLRLALPEKWCKENWKTSSHQHVSKNQYYYGFFSLSKSIPFTGKYTSLLVGNGEENKLNLEPRIGCERFSLIIGRIDLEQTLPYKAQNVIILKESGKAVFGSEFKNQFVEVTVIRPSVSRDVYKTLYP